MAGGLMQLVAFGAQDVYLSSNPQVTFFKVVHRRHTSFAMESIEQVFNGSADFGRKVTANISRNGDLIHKAYLRVELPAISVPEGTAFRWLNWIGHILIKTVDIDIGGQRIDRHYGDWMHIWNELTQTPGHQLGYASMLGNTPELTQIYDNTFGTAGRGAMTVPSKTLWIPLEFWWCRNPGLALPLIALQYHEVKINLEFNDAKNCFWAGRNTALTASDPPTWTTNLNLVSTPSLATASLFIDYIFLDTDERRRFASAPHEYLIEQLQFGGDESTSQTSNNFKLNFNHPCKEIVWVVQPDDNISESAPFGKQWFNYTDKVMASPSPSVTDAMPGIASGGTYGVYIPVAADGGENPTARAKLSLNGHERLSERDGEYWNLVQTYQHHENVPSKGINVYSFALKPEEHQPSGSCNMSRIDNANLTINLTTNAVNLNGSPRSVKSKIADTFMVLLDVYDPAVFGDKVIISTNGYARCNTGRIHAMILDAGGLTVDHINRVPLDNRRKNLRVASISMQNGNRMSSVEIDPPEELKTYFDEMPAFLRWDSNYLRFVSDKYNINGTRGENVSIVNKFRDAAVKLKTAIIEDIEYSRHLVTLNQLRDDYIQINKLVHSQYPEHFDMYDDSADKVYRYTPKFIDQCLSKLPPVNYGDVMHGPLALSTTYRTDESSRVFYMKRGDYDEKEIVLDMDFLEHFKSSRAVDVDSGSPIIQVGDSKIVLRAYVWTNLLKRKVPHGFKVGIRNGNPMDVRASNLVLIDEGVRQRRKTVVEGFNDDLVRMIDPDATAYSRISKNGEMYFVFVDFTIHRVMPALCMEPRNVSVLRPKMLLREYVWNGLSTSGDGSSGVVVPLNYDMFDVRTSNLVKVHGLSSSKSFSAPASSDVPSVVRARVPWEFMPFGLKYCFNKAQSMEGFNQSKMIDPKTKHWYLSIKEDAGIDSVKVAKIEESLGACYRALVEFPGVGRFPPDSPPIDVFQTFDALSVRKGEQSKTFMVLMDDYYPAVFGNELTISTNGYAKCNVGHIHTMNHDAGVTVDHINRIPLDNRRKNLRVATTMSVQNGNRVSSVEIDPPEELKPYFDEMPAFLRWDRNYLRFVSDKYNINCTRSEKVSIVNKFRDAAVKLKTAIIEDIEYSRHLATLNQLRDDYIQINKLVHSLYPEHFDMYDDSTDKPYIPGILAKSGSSGSPTISFSNAPDTGLFNPVARTLGVVAGGTEMVRVSDTTVSLMGDLVVSSNIVPMTNATQYIGTSTMHFKEAWIDELHISSNTLYIGDTPVLCADNDAVSIRADPGQGITLTTTGDGETSLVSAKEVNVVSEGGVTMRVSGPIGRVNIQSSGAGGTVNLGAEKEIVMTAPLTTISSNMIVKGDLTVEGTQLTVNTQTVTVEDNIIVLNSGVAFISVLGYSDNYTPGASITFQRGIDNTRMGKMYFSVQNTTSLTGTLLKAMTIDYNGNVGIGTSTPQSKLHVVGGDSIFDGTVAVTGYLKPKTISFDDYGNGYAGLNSDGYSTQEVVHITSLPYSGYVNNFAITNGWGGYQNICGLTWNTWNIGNNQYQRYDNTKLGWAMLNSGGNLDFYCVGDGFTGSDNIPAGARNHPLAITPNGITVGGTINGNGSGLTALNANNISSGTLDLARIPNLDASKVTTGTLNATRIPNLDASKVTTGTLNATRIPNLDASKVTTGTLNATRIPNLDASKVTTGTLHATRIPNLDASKVTTGTLNATRIPNLDASKVTAGTLNATRIPNLDASKVTTGTLHATRIPNLDASKVTTGTLHATRIPNLDASKITAGTISEARLPVVNIQAIKGQPCSYAFEDGFYVFSLRCSMERASKGFPDLQKWNKFVRETLENFDVDPPCGIIHGDVKLENMIYCAKDDRYRLIDWARLPTMMTCARVHVFNLAVRSILGGIIMFKLDKVTDKKLRLDILDGTWYLKVPIPHSDEAFDIDIAIESGFSFRHMKP
eukprot:gene906-biopygen4510